MEKLENLKTLIDTLNGDVAKFFDKGNKSAATRARQTLQEIKKVAQELRLEISSKKNS
jgi:hypothetical protein